MSDDRKRADWLIVAGAVVIVLAAIGLYACGYLMMGTLQDDPFGDPQTVRVYDAKWKVMLFYPASKVESLFLRKPIGVGRQGELLEYTGEP